MTHNDDDIIGWATTYDDDGEGHAAPIRRATPTATSHQAGGGGRSTPQAQNPDRTPGHAPRSFRTPNRTARTERRCDD